MQARFLELVAASTLLVGHALQNDLRQLRIVHTRVIDTAVIYPHPKVRRGLYSSLQPLLCCQEILSGSACNVSSLSRHFGDPFQLWGRLVHAP